MTEYQLPPLPKPDGELTVQLGAFGPISFSAMTMGHAVNYARTAIAPLLQDLAAHEASNRIKTENLETLREQNAKLRKALQRLMRSSPTDSDLIAASWEEFDIDEAMRAQNAARAVLGENDE